ncbi:ABC transporter ATP-binding protein [Microvirga sp. CF3016]|jgi:branched-chain amino acid transport system ATP-binding protein|uniref:ABC transporter ATP-binding protein n=1 Tax=Microvirga sp. CF3016 TaxID=3110181 RepID=UPI002DF3517E|nr:ABC transporter ATP-binding protein [Microvirga sp. CF3016]MEE1612267.1 ABC transporter ATP-binding protein [Microvirga sp. CF3016]HEV2564490.1 ABC transporter ATP-binding protein [Microvirga sp.]
MSKPLLEIWNLCAFYGRAQVLFDLTFRLHPGEVMALVGRNGAGKTTTLKAIMGLVSASAKQATFKGQSLDRLPTYKIARLGLGYVPEDRRIFTDLTVDENLETGRRPAGEGRSPWTPERLFRLFPNLAEMRGRQGNQMSGGEQQMLAIARTLMGNPDAILLDEPSEGIAPVIVQMMAEAIRAMKAEGVAVLLSEQNWAFAAGISDRACVIERGEIRFQGSMAELMADEALRAETLGV